MIFDKENKLQKSFCLLYPLVGVKYNAGYLPKNSYLFWDEYSIENFELIVFYEQVGKEFEKILLLSKYLIACYEVEGGIVYIYDLISDFSNEVSHFLNGEYSKFSESAKRTIMKYYGANTLPTKADNNLTVAVALFPELYKDIAKEEMGEEVDFTELFSKYDRISETGDFKLLGDKCCKEKKIITFDR